MPLTLNLSRGKLLQKCVDVIDSFDPKKTTVDAYVQDAEILKDKAIGEIELKFIHQIFYGSVRYSKFLKLFVTSFLYKNPATAIRSEKTLYAVLAYVLFFRLEELGVQEMRLLMTSGLGTTPALSALLQYALDVEELEKWVKVEWCKVYDLRYIEEEVIGRLQSFADELQPLKEEMEFKATGTVKSSDATMMPSKDKFLTQPKPFNLTQPKPRLIPEPEVISREVKALPVPSTIHRTSLSEVEEQKKKRLEEEKAKTSTKYDPAHHFKLNTLARRDGSEVEELARKVDQERMAECTFQPKIAKFTPPTADAPVRPNIASVLREDALIRQKQAKECELLKRYEEDLHDASEFYRWQEEMKEKDHLAEEQRVHHRMVEMQLAREGAMEAFESQVRQKGISAAQQREELKEELVVKVQEAEVELASKQELVKETQGGRVNARFAEEKELALKAERAERIRREKEAEVERKRLEDAHEMERRKDLIKQIRALEKVPVERFKQFDPAEAPCQGLLEEMSHSELWERLKILQAQEEKELIDKRERQLAHKAEKEQEIAEKAEVLERIRERAKQEAKARHEAIRKKKRDNEEAEKAYREQRALEVAEKMEKKRQEKRAEEQRARRELKELKMKRQFDAPNADPDEARRKEMEKAGKNREIRESKAALKQQVKALQVKRQEKVIRHGNHEVAKEDYRTMLAAVDDRVQRAKVADLALKADILKANTLARNSQKHLEHNLRQELGHSMSKYSGGPQRMARST